MRDLVVREALEAMARDAAKRFRELVAAGREIPYDVRESGGGSPLPQYVPLTASFVREHAPLLRELDSFGSACAALESVELAGRYLEDAGVVAPAEGRRRAELAAVLFLARMWEDSTDFSLDDGRLRRAIAELQANGDAGEGEIEVVVPLRGLRMEGTRMDLATATIVRADTVDVPAEARAAEAGGGAGWEPTFLAVTRVPAGRVDDDGDEGASGPDAGTRAVQAFRALITALRLFKPGGVALGPHAWTRAGSGRWRRVATGAGRPRPGGYYLAETELGALAVFTRATAMRLGSHGPSTAGLERSISRFEAGLERTAAMDALNDYLLTLRFLLEGGGPADMGISMRVAALCAEPDRRADVKGAIDRALALERQLWSGEPASGEGEVSPTETAIAVEELTRAILKDAACGHLGSDLRATADEILLADGLAVGEGTVAQRGETAEWTPSADPDETDTTEEAQVPDPASELDRQSPATGGASPSPAPVRAAPDPDGPRYGRDAPVVQSELWFDGLDDDATEMQVIRRPERSRTERDADRREEMNADAQRSFEPATPERGAGHASRPERGEPREGESPVLRLLELHDAEREATAARVANLFPAPETTEWEIREISYDRSRRADVADNAS